jgi:hypothetical protein
MPIPVPLPARCCRTALMAMATLVAWGFDPTVRVEAPKDPITINLNVKIDADVRVRLEQQATEDINKRAGIF